MNKLRRTNTSQSKRSKRNRDKTNENAPSIVDDTKSGFSNATNMAISVIKVIATWFVMTFILKRLIVKEIENVKASEAVGSMLNGVAAITVDKDISSESAALMTPDDLDDDTSITVDKDISSENATLIIPYDLDDDASHVPSIQISEKERRRYHPVVVFPHSWVKDEQIIPLKNGKRKIKTIRKKIYHYKVLNLTENDETAVAAKKTDDSNNIKRNKSCNPFLKLIRLCNPTTSDEDTKKKFMVGKYNENRNGLYMTPLFLNTSNQIDGYHGERTIHMGIDLFGPVGHKVFAFADGKVHSAGYNDALGDYGYVVVLEHEVGETIITNNGDKSKQKVWALYGHLDSKSIQGKTAGKRIKKGQLVGKMGDVHENGGWPNPHVHFQLSIYPPETHDMPGVVSQGDREKAVMHYPDPQIILGKLY